MKQSLGSKLKENNRFCTFVKGLSSFFFFAILFFSIHSSVYAATRYVNSDSDGSANNPTRAFDDSSYAVNDSYQTFSAAYGAASVGDIIEISGGSSGETYLGHTSSIAKANLTIQGSSISEFDGIVTINYPGSGLYTMGLNADGITTQNLTISRNDADSTGFVMRIYKDNIILRDITIKNADGYGIRIEATADNTLIDQSIFDASSISGGAALYVINGLTVTNTIFTGNSTITGSTIYLAADSGTSNFNNVVFNTSASRVINLNTGTIANFYNSVFASPGTINSHNFYYNTNGGIINTTNSLIQGIVRTPHVFTSGSGTGTWNSTNDILNAFPYFTRTKANLGYLLFSTDDRTNISYFKTIADYAMSNYDISMTIYIHQTLDLTSDDKSNLQTLYKAGHEVGTHTRHHTNLILLNAFSVTYSGANADMALVVSASGTSLSVTGTSDTQGPIDLTSTAYDTVGEVCTEIESWTNFTCILKSDSGGFVSTNVLSNSLKDVTTNLPIGLTDIPFDDDTGPNNRLYKEEITNSIADLESALQEDPDSSDYTVKTMAFPFNSANSQVITWIRDNTSLIGVRSNYDTGTVLDKSWLENIDLYNFYYPTSTDSVKGPDYNSLSVVDQQSRIEQSARVMATYASNGFVTGMLTHNASNMTFQEFQWLLDEIILYSDAYNIGIMSTVNIANEIKTSGDWSDGGGGFWTRTFSGADDLRLKYNSSLINVGTTVAGRTTDILGNPLVGTPDIGAYEFQAPSAFSSLTQYRSDGTTSINAGGYTPETSVVLKFSMSSPNAVDSITPQVEVQEAGTDFTGTQTHSGTAVSYTGSEVTGTVTVTGLTDGTSYHWQARGSNTASTGSWTTTGETTDFIVDTAISVNPSISFPSNYTNGNTKPTLVFKKATDAGAGISSYSVTLDSGKNKSFSISSIPTAGNGSASYIWKDDDDVRVEFLHEDDSDSTNDEIRIYFKGLDNNELTEGKHTWKVTAYDSVSNQTTYSADFYIDRTPSSVSELAIADVSTVNSGVSYNLNITNRMPSFSGLTTDIYRGSTVTNSNGTKDTFDKVSSGPKTLTLTLKRLKDGENSTSEDAVYIDHLTEDFSLSEIQDDGGIKSSRFYITTPFPLVDGYYKVQLSFKDEAGNTFDQPVFYLSLNSSKTNTFKSLFSGQNLETKIIKQETIPTETEEEEKQVEEQGYDVKIKVVDTENNPVEGAKVTIHSKVQETITDENGIAQFSNVEPGDHRVLIAYDDYEGEQKLTLTGEEVKEFDLTIQVKKVAPFSSNVERITIIVLGLAVIGLSVFVYKARRKLKASE